MLRNEKMTANRLRRLVRHTAMIGFCSLAFTACQQTATPLRITEPTVYETGGERVARLGEIMHSNRTKVNGSTDLVTHEIELAGIHSGYGAATVVNMIYRKMDATGKNITRPKVISHKLSDGKLVNLGGAAIEIIDLKTDYMRFVVTRDFNQALNR
jgi:hypothetical protein